MAVGGRGGGGPGEAGAPDVGVVPGHPGLCSPRCLDNKAADSDAIATGRAVDTSHGRTLSGGVAFS